MPNRPITATRKSKPPNSSVVAEGQAQLAGDGVDADGGQREAEHHAAMVLVGGSLPMPTKLQKVRKKTENFSAGPNFSAKLATSGRRA